MAFSQLDEEKAFLKAMIESLTANGLRPADLLAFSIVADAGEEAEALTLNDPDEEPMTARRVIEAYSDCRVDYLEEGTIDAAIEKYLP